MTADVQRVTAETDRELALLSALFSHAGDTSGNLDRLRAYVADAEKRAAAKVLRETADAVRHQLPGYIGRIDTADSLDDRAAALDPS